MRKDTRCRLFGIRDDSGKIKRYYKDDTGRHFTLEGSYHHNMMTRGSNPNYRKVFKTYKETTISEEFKDFNYFAEWCNKQVGFGNMGWCLDKDIIGLDSRYCEETCVFVPPIINIYFTKPSKVRELPLGVSWCESENCYKAYCSQLNGKNKTLGRFKNINDANNAYQKYKSSLANNLIVLYKDKLDNRVVEKLKYIYETGEFK